MFGKMEIQENIKEVFDEVLGVPRRDNAGSGGWYEYNCPSCAEENCGTPDGKYNLAVNYEIGSDNGMYMHCWRCGFGGALSKLMRIYGTPELYRKYKDLVKEFREAHLYEIESGKIVISDDMAEKEELKLPQNTFTVFEDNQSAKQALQYLHDRGVDDFIIKKHSIKYVGNDWGNGYRNMVIIPSYDAFGNLNYYAGRDFTGKDKWNKKNPDVPKTEIVFNEELINWYEPVTLVEGPFDHIVTPNSIPLLGKTIDDTYLVYKTLMEKAKHTVNIMLDSDAINSAIKNYNILNTSELRDRVRIIYCPDGYDPSLVHQHFGRKGILNLLSSATKLSDYTLTNVAYRENIQKTLKGNTQWKKR